DDVRLAVDEACSLLLTDTAPGSSLDLRMIIQPPSTLDIAVTARLRHRWLPPRKSFSWTVLQALVDDVSTRASRDGRAVLRLRIRARGPTGSAS
ncbi:MAG: hypothetical protein Q8P61_02025, partial [Candidatus Nanopelagicales bacterium]|nr:hypothetical protein [Candidatus Nanopelagicales bacterium]